VITSSPVHLASDYEVVVVGAGPAGLAAAVGARESGAERVLVVDREPEPGGILNQCIHHGFGLHHFKEELTGPEYAQRFVEDALDHGVDVVTDAFVEDARFDGGPRAGSVKLMTSAAGVRRVDTRTVVLAMGARERTRGAIRIPGTRPSGVMTAGLAQRFVNVLGYLPGRRAVILGSGDIGLIMARRLTLEGVEVAGVFEIMPHANGLTRNLVQCLHDFDIPLHLSHTVAEIHGRDRVDGVTVAPVDDELRPRLDAAWHVPCDTLLLSIGLIPENELSRRIGVELDPATGGPVVSSTMETSVPGVFAAGNVAHIHDIVDYVTEESLVAGRHAGLVATGRRPPPDTIRLVAGDNVASCVPHSISSGREHTLYVRVRHPLERSVLELGDVHRRRLRYVVPAEMVSVKVRPVLLESFRDDSLTVSVRPRDEHDGPDEAES
jgi:thioredoxin reductase